ncbi:MAG: glutaminyl-peptide cyclotransferase [Anaerolineae bacterium]|nr:glutaminyl-peptide cyclotransferase [Anaerolineae bacterium]
MKYSILAISLILALGISGTVLAQENTPEATPESTSEFDPAIAIPYYIPNILETYPRDPETFTQGLVWSDGRLFQSAGQYGESQLLENDLETGDVIQSAALDAEYFAEGLALVEDRLIQITWQEGTAFVYDVDTFEVLDTYSYEGEGWGLCYDGEVLWMSDGSPNLFKRDAETFELLETVPVTLLGSPVTNLNELECVDGSVYANIWFQDYIVQIDPETGMAIGLIDARQLLPAEARMQMDSGAVLNGIAYIPERDTFLLTGKLWPTIFEVELEEAGSLVLNEGG